MFDFAVARGAQDVAPVEIEASVLEIHAEDFEGLVISEFTGNVLLSAYPNVQPLRRPLAQCFGIDGDDELTVAETQAFRASVEDSSPSISNEDLKKKYRLD